MSNVASDASPPLRAELLGHVRLWLGEREIAEDAWPRRTARTLLLLLLVTPNHRVPRDRVLDLLWPHASPEAAASGFYQALHALRRVLEPALVTGRASRYVVFGAEMVGLRPDATVWVDAEVFEAALARVATLPISERTAALRDAIALYGGDLLADEPYADWPMARRERLRHAWRRAVLELVDLELAMGESSATPGPLEDVLVADPTDEAAHRALMRRFAAANRREDALLQFERCAQILRDELGVEPSEETLALRIAIAGTSPSVRMPISEPARPARIDNLPASPNRLVGRIRELDALHDLLGDRQVRLVTITGPGGIGKTRLALAAAAQIGDEFSGGVAFVPLASIHDPSLVMPTIARTLDLEEAGTQPLDLLLQEALRQRELLLVLDNVEQVLTAAPDLADLLAACPGVTYLVTSREPLRLRAERVFPLPTLAVPPRVGRGPDRLTATNVARYEAAALFIERARAINPAYVLTDDDAPVLAEVCHRLDGLPLAIELAAARGNVLVLRGLLARLERRLPLLTGGPRDLPLRQRTMRDAISWSHDLLSEPERALFRRVAAFVGGFTLEAAESIVPAWDEPADGVLIGLASLVDKSLVRREESDDGPRFGMLETIREFGLERLETSGELSTIRDSHAAYYRCLAEDAEPLLHAAGQSEWLDRLEVEHDNLRAALGWARERPDAELALRLSGSLAEFWRMSGHTSEGRTWLEWALSQAGDAPPGARAQALVGAGALARAQGDYEQATAHLSAALDDWQDLGDRRATGQTLGLIAAIASAQGEYDRAIELNEQALDLFDATTDRADIAASLNRLGIIASDQGNYARATDFFERGLALYRVLDDRNGQGRVLNNLGSMAFWQEDYRRAAALHTESLAIWRALGDRPHAAVLLANLGEDLRAEGDLERAMATANEGLQLSREVGDKRSTATALFIVGSLMQHHRYDPRSADPLVEGLLVYQHVGDRLGMAWCLEALAGPAVATGQPGLAAQLCGAAEALREQVHVPRQPAERPAYERHVTSARAALSHATFTDAWATGRASPLETIIARATELTIARTMTTDPI